MVFQLQPQQIHSIVFRFHVPSLQVQNMPSELNGNPNKNRGRKRERHQHIYSIPYIDK